MQSPEDLPISPELILENHRKYYILFYEHVNRWAQQNKEALEWILSRSDPAPPDRIGILFERWMESFIVDYPTWSTMQSFSGIQSSPSIHIFAELSRSRFILSFPKIAEETRYVREHGERPEHFDISQCSFLTEDGGIAWEKPVLMYTQQDVVRALLLLTKRVDGLPRDSFASLKKMVDLLFTRNSVFFCEETSEEILNMELMRQPGVERWRPSRDYLTFSSIYFHALFRRLYYREAIAESALSLPPGVKERTQQFILDLVNSLGSDGFEDCYNKAVEEAYGFPGDREWFRYRYPDMPMQTGPMLECFRKEDAKRYFTEYRVSRETILNSVEMDSHTGNCARICLLNAIDQYMRTHFSIPWRDGIVIPNGAIEGSQVHLYQNKAPYLLQLYSRYWVYDDATIYPLDSIYESFALWLLLLESRYRSRLFSTDLSALVKRIIHGERKKTFIPPYR